MSEKDSPGEQGKPDENQTGQLTVTIDNEDSGRDIEIHAGRGQSVQDVIDDMYRELGRDRHPEDRLRCAEAGEDVFQHAGLKLKDYLERCEDLKWVFAGPTGGAAR